MSQPKWTPAQLQAIQDRGGGLLLSAAAGSGKTAVLTQRAVELLADEGAGVSAEQLLVVTFTNAAAAQLRSRMAAALEEKLAQQPDNTCLKRQKLLLGQAAICTVDSFCIDLVTRHFHETGIPGDFTIITPAQEAALRQQALEATMEEACGDEAFRQFASQFGKARSDQDAANAILRLYDVARAMARPQDWWDGLCQDYTVRTTPADTRWGKELLQNAEVLADGVCRRLQYAIDEAEADEDFAAVAALLRTEHAQAASLLEAIRAADWPRCHRESRGLQFARYPTPSKKADPLCKGRLKALRDACKDLMKELPERYFVSDVTEFLAEQAVCLPMVRALAAAVSRFSALLFEKKQEARAFSFDDFEHAALELLQNPDGSRTDLAEELSAHYVMVMVDEYQDTNDLQDRLYHLLARPDLSDLFLVGDVKQSIYGFREAKPACFIQKRDAYAPYDGAHFPATLYLSHNFRSTPSLLHGVNDLFCPLLCRAVGGVDYTGGELLRPGLAEDPLPLPVQVLITDASPPEDTKEKNDAQSGTPQNALAPPPDDSGTVARLIARLLAEGAPVREGAGVRPCRAGDICILLRSPSARSRRYTEKLEALGIGVACRAEDALLADPQVGLLLSYLRVLDNPGQDIHLAAVLLSPLVGLSADDLVALRLACPKGSLYAALLQQTAGPAAVFLQQLRALRRRVAGMPVQEICATLLDESGLYHLAGAAPGGESSQQNLRLFQAVSAEYAGSGGLAGFLRLVDAAMENNRPLADRQAAAAPADKVQLMSIHASKGLEFPIVILAGADHGFNQQDAYGRFLCHSELGVAFPLQSGQGRTLLPTLALRALSARIMRQTADEEMRLLYVALTRAKDRLILSWTDKKPAAGLEKRAATLAACGGRPDTLALRRTGADGMSHWLQLALLTHPDAGALRALCGREDLPRRDTEGHFAVTLAPYATPAPPPAGQPVRHAVADAALAETLLRNFAAQPPQPPALPIKVSVSALSHRQEAPTLDKPLFLYKQGMTAAQRGTALHRFLQLADLARARADLPGELRRLVADGFLEEAAAQQLDKAVLQRFLQGELAARMLQAPTLLREYELISRIPAADLPGQQLPAQTPPGQQPPATPVNTPPDALANAAAGASAPAGGSVYLLGIADCVLLYPDAAELVDYKTDRGKTAAQLLQTYGRQLSLYRQTIQRRLGVPVRRSVIYSFALGQEIEVPPDEVLFARDARAASDKETPAAAKKEDLLATD